MAGDWLKMEVSTPEKSEVLAITARMGWDDADLTVGKLFRLWRWFDQHTLDGNAPRVTAALLDRIVGVTGFCEAVQESRWLQISDDGISLPKFDRHNGNTAKNRALTAKRVAKHKAGNAESNTKGNASGNAVSVSAALPREEKRRSIKPPTPLPGGFVAFWNAWPQHHRKAAKPQCARKWDKDGCEAFAAKVVAAVNTAKRSEAWLKNGGEFIPAPLVWLNQARWEAPAQEPPSNTVPSQDTAYTAELLAKMAADDAAAQTPEAHAARVAAMAKLGRIGKVAA